MTKKINRRAALAGLATLAPAAAAAALPASDEAHKAPTNTFKPQSHHLLSACAVVERLPSDLDKALAVISVVEDQLRGIDAPDIWSANAAYWVLCILPPKPTDKLAALALARAIIEKVGRPYYANELLDGLPASAAEPSGEDPFFAAIAAHDAAWSAMWEVRPKYRRGRKTRKYLHAIERYHATREALLSTPPTTRDGLAAALRSVIPETFPDTMM